MVNPTWPALFINPHYLARKGLIDHIRDLAPRIKGRLLDVGCGLKPYADLFPAASYNGLELYAHRGQRANAADLLYDGGRFPFKTGTFDAILCSQVLEHVDRPQSFLASIRRITKPGGHLLLTVPFFWGEHEKPADFQRYTSFGLTRLLEDNGFEVVAQRKSMPGFRALFALGAANLYERLHSGSRLANLVLAGLVAAPLTLLGLLAGRVLPENPDIYLDNIILGRKK